MTSWEKTWDDDSQGFYWWNTETDETTWIDPASPDFVEKRKEELQDSDDNPEITSPPSSSDAAAPNPTSTDPTPQPSSSPADPNAVPDSYYQSQEYYNWYYSYYANANATANTSDFPLPPDTGSEAGTTNPEYTPQPGYTDYSVSAGFNPLTGKFQNIAANDRYKPEEYFSQLSKAERQMNFFFDLKQYQEQRAAEAMAKKNEKPKRLSKKEVQMFKERKKIKKDEKMRKKYAD
ncbi:hypothetical protein HK098_001395 [Nowakowskiella sp. JEL0407]|nr:hypothetical protein HK098_001395 [Nowakowskiella sp. JEL0407]